MNCAQITRKRQLNVEVKKYTLLSHYYVILPYKDKRTRKIWERITLW